MAVTDPVEAVAVTPIDDGQPQAPVPDYSPNGGAPADEPPPSTLPIYTARQLMAIPDPDESALLLGPLVVRGARTIVVGDTGHGKTTLVLQMGAAILTGDDMLGHQGARTGPLLVLDLEQGIRSIKRSLRDAGLADRDDVIYVPVPDGLALDDRDNTDRDELARIVADRRPAALILDPYYKAHRADANEERAVVDLFRYLDALRAEYQFALILPAHPRKDPASGAVRKLSLHDVAGSGAVVRGAELVLGLERLSHGYARLRILKDRDGDLPVGEAWPLLFTRGEGFRLDPKEEQTAEQLEARVLADTGDWRTLKEWRAELGVGETRARQTLDQLTEAGQTEYAVGPPGRNKDAKCWRVPREPQSTPMHPDAPLPEAEGASGALGCIETPQAQSTRTAAPPPQGTPPAEDAGW
jgi:hypothetical protein